MNDLIERSAVIDLIDKYTQDMSTDYWTANYGIPSGVFEDEIMELPSAQLERPKGKWMPHIEKTREYIGTVLVNVRYDYWLCDTCGYRVEDGQPLYNFCPNCGADMRGREDE